jgi:hypothetical protein
MEIFSAPKKVKKVAEEKVVGRLLKRRQSAFERFPLLFTLLATFGLVATLYGFERLIDRIEFLNDNSFILLGIGLLALIITGTLYKKL